MRSFLIFVFVFMATLSIAQVQAIIDPQQISSRRRPNAQKFSLDKLYTTRATGDSVWSPNGRSIAFISNITGRNNLWIVPADGGWPVQLTVSDQRQSSPAWSPDGKWIAYMSDHDGNEQWDVFVVSPQSGEVINLTNTPEIAELNPLWSPDGKSLAYAVKPKVASMYEIDLLDMATRTVRHLTTNTPKDQILGSAAWSHDGKSIAYSLDYATGKDSNIFVVDVSTGKSRKLTEHDGLHHYQVNDWSPDGRSLLITSDAGNGYQNVALLRLDSQRIDWLTSGKEEVTGGNFSPDSKVIVWTKNVDGNQDIIFHEVATGRSTPLGLNIGVNSLGGGQSAFARDGKRLLYFHNGPDSPPDVWAYDLNSKQSHQVTHSLVAGIHGADMVQPDLIHFPSSDGKWKISAFVYTPYNLERKPVNPAIVYIHGGPTSQTVNLFSRNIQYLVNQGYIVIAPNYRGSTGFGKEFQEANFMDMGGGDLQDNLAAAEWIKKTAYVDPKKLVIMGGSYGGYMTMMGVTKAPRMWAAAVAIVPFVNWFTEIENEDPELREIDLATMGDPVKEKARYEERSPINFVNDISAPLLLLAGGNDPRCPKSEAQQVADALRKNGGVVELKIYENEGHGFARVENIIDAYTRVANFLKTHVPPAQ